MFQLMIFELISYLVLIVGNLISVAFLVLLERKILGYVQFRKGPNKVGIIGLLQPFADAIKLFLKDNFFMVEGSYLVYYFSPVLGFLNALVLLLTIVDWSGVYYSLLFMVIGLSAFIFVIMSSSWSSNSKYSMLGGFRGVAQTLSYEICMFFVLLTLFLYCESFYLYDFLKYQIYIVMLVLNFPLFLMFFFCMLADLSRTPFDFIEGESELVSGFNTEYMSSGFALLFLAEYMLVIIFSVWSMIIFLGLNMNSFFFFFFFLSYLILLILIRGELPRMRYDELMSLCWYILLPLIMNMLFLLCLFKYWIYKFI